MPRAARPLLASQAQPGQVRLVRLTGAQAAGVLGGELPAGLVAGRGWPHEDTAAGLRIGLSTGSDAVEAFLVELGGVVIGDAGTFGGPDPQGRVEIGYGLAPPYRGRGHGTALVALLAAHVLGRPGVGAALARVDPANIASRAALRRCGFAATGADPDGLLRYELLGAGAGAG